MKSTFALLFFLVFGISLYAQNGISFQGIARDPQGNAIVDKDISVKFTIGSFKETQKLTTDNFGVFSAIIGKGTLESGATKFDELVFANITENLTVEVDETIIYNDQFNTVPYAKSAENGVPPGSIMPFAGPVNKIPEGWLLCDGKSLAKIGEYQKLYEAIGILWGDDGGNFKIPDLRGMFLRGSNEGRTDVWKDPDNRIVGNLQQDSYESHNHPDDFSITNDGSHNHRIGFATYWLDDDDDDRRQETGYNTGTSRYINSNTDGSHSHTINGNVLANGGAETRPNNAAVVYMIKY